MESGLQAYIEKGWWVEFPLDSPWAGPGKPCKSDVRMENYFENQSTANDVRVGGGLAKVGGA